MTFSLFDVVKRKRKLPNHIREKAHFGSTQPADDELLIFSALWLIYQLTETQRPHSVVWYIIQSTVGWFFSGLIYKTLFSIAAIVDINSKKRTTRIPLGLHFLNHWLLIIFFFLMINGCFTQWISLTKYLLVFSFWCPGQFCSRDLSRRPLLWWRNSLSVCQTIFSQCNLCARVHVVKKKKSCFQGNQEVDSAHVSNSRDAQNSYYKLSKARDQRLHNTHKPTVWFWLHVRTNTRD